ncbi:PAS domain-containing sensor histidine kinase [Hyalangium versicolor]|uniref:PAS domain-containing sensor histidine kinase n=1 Tax=Hyalangium versicolor TaxID=2861190 RepID=UPI001CCF9993|nr:PAS domain-containing sensor histidine kinase [Hyalangium versicolor]
MSSNDLEPVRPEGEVLRALADKITAMLAYWDSSLRCRFANRAYERWFGVSPEALIGKHLSELLGPLYALNLPYIQGALRGEPQEFEREIPNPVGGPPRYSLANYIPDIVDGVVRGFYVLVTDVSEIKRAQLALQESEERFRLTIDEAPIGMALVAPGGRFARVNRVLCEIVGYTEEELMGLTFAAITHPEDVGVDRSLAGLLSRGEIPRYQRGKRYIRKDGTIVEVMLSVSLLRGHDGAPRFYVAQIEDITERKRFEKEQRFLSEVGLALANTLDYEETLTRIADLVVQDVADLCIVELVETSEEARRIKVTCRDSSRACLCERLSQPPHDRHHPHLLQSILETRRPVLMQHASVELIASLSRSEEYHRALQEAEIGSLVAVPLVARGRLLGAIAWGASRGSTVYGPADLRLAEELAQRASLSIENARLYRAACRATHARDDALGVVAHDLRNPLNSILMHTHILRSCREDTGGRSQKAVEAIERSAIRMSRLIQDLLDVSCMDAGHLSVEQARVSSQQVVSDAVETQKPLATSASLELRLEVAPNLPDVWADHDRLTQIFENLIGNALKFTKPGGRITVGAVPAEGEVRFWVADTGNGISAEEVPHLFERFWQARKTERRGAGLGLPIVKGIVEAHHGRIWVESTPGQGSTFFFTIPTVHRVAESRRA